MNRVNLIFLLLLSVVLNVQAQLYPIEIKGKFGYVDNRGELVIQPTYDLAMPFNNGYAVVALGLQPCLINQNNKRVIDTGLYTQITDYSEGLCMVEDFKRRKHYVDTNNQKVISLSPDIYEARPFNSGIAVVSKQTTYTEIKFGKDITTLVYRFAYINKRGDTLTGFEFEDCGDFFNGYSRAIRQNKFGLLNTELKEVLPFKFNQLSQVEEGKVIVNENNKYGIYDVTGKWILKPTYPLIYDYNDGMAGFMNDKNLYGFLNEEGTVAIKPIYQSIRPFSEGKAAVFADGKWGFVNKQGTWVIRNVYDNARMFSEGMSAIMYKRKWGFINEEGKLIIPCDFDAVGDFNDGLALVELNDITVYINKRGVIMPQLKK